MVSENVLTNYLLFSQVMREIAQKDANPAARERHSKIWARLQNARVFSFPASTFAALYRAVDIWTTRTIAKQTFQLPIEEGATAVDPTPQESTEHFVTIAQAGSKVEHPRDLPFDFIYVALDAGEHGQATNTLPSQVMSRLLPLRSQVDIDDISGAWFAGYLISHDGCVDGFMRLDRISQPPGYVLVPIRVTPSMNISFLNIDATGIERDLTEPRWVAPYSLDPWLVNLIVDIIHEQRKFIIAEPRSLDYRMRMERVAKKLHIKKAVPPPYYTVQLSQSVAYEIAQRKLASIPRRSYEFTYQFDVMGHERVRIMRGPLPLDEKLRKKLEQRKYRIFEMDVPADAAAKIQSRFIRPKNRDEWLAILTSHVSPHKRGPEDAPYIPAVRRIPAKRARVEST